MGKGNESKEKKEDPVLSYAQLRMVHKEMDTEMEEFAISVASQVCAHGRAWGPCIVL